MKFIVRRQRNGATRVEWTIVIAIISFLSLLCAGCAGWAHVMHSV